MRREPAAAAIDERWPFVFCLCYVSHVTCFVSRSRREEVRVQYRVAQKDRTEEEQQGTGTGVNKSALSGSRGAFRNSRVNKHKQAHSSPFSLSRLRPLATSSSSSHLNTWLATKHKARTSHSFQFCRRRLNNGWSLQRRRLGASRRGENPD